MTQQQSTKRQQHKSTSLFKKIGIGVFGLIALVIIAAIILVATVDPNDYKNKIEDYVSTNYNTQLKIGSIAWDFLPSIGLAVQAVDVQNISEQNPTETTEMVKVTEAKVSLALWPLFQGKVAVDSIELTAPTIWFHQLENGESNWSTMLAALASSSPNKPEKKEQSQTPQEMLQSLEAININSFQLTDGALQLLGTQVIELSDLQFKLDDFGLNQDISLATEFKLDLPAQKLVVHNQANFDVNINPEKGLIRLDNAKINENISIDTMQQELDLAFNGLINLNDYSAQLNDLKITNDRFQLKSSVQASALDSQPAFKVKFAQQELAIGQLLKQWQVLTAADTETIAFMDKTLIEGQINATPTDIQANFPILGIGPGQSQNPGKLSLKHSIEKNATQLSLNIKTIDLDQLLPESTASADKPSAPTSGNTPEDEQQETPLPKELLKTTQFNAQIAIDQLIFKSVDHSLGLDVQLDQGVLAIKPLRAKAYEGQAHINATLDANKTPASFTLNTDIQHLAIHKALQAYLFDPWMKGLLNTQAKFTSQGDTVEALISNLQGTTQVSIDEAILPSLNLQSLALSQMDKLKPGIRSLVGDNTFLKTPEVLAKDTKLKSFVAQFNVTPKVVKSKTIKGSLNGQPLNGDIVYERDTGTIVLSSLVKLPAKNPQYADIQWPIQCKGNLNGLAKCSLDTQNIEDTLKTAFKAKAKAKVKSEVTDKIKQEEQKVKNKAKEKLKEELGEDVESQLKGLFNR